MTAKTLSPTAAPGLPRLTQASAPLTHALQVVDESGQPRAIAIPAERALTIYVDRREVVTLMTLGAHPEWLVLGYLLNQQLIDGVAAVASVTVDWDVGAAAVLTHTGIDRIEERTAHRVVTTGCGQGSVFGSVLDALERTRLPDAIRLKQSTLYRVVDTIRLSDSVYKVAGSVHACALFAGDQLQLHVEDVGRHNAVDTIAGWMALNGTAMDDGERLFYTTGRMTSEMVIKSAQMGVALLVSRSGITQMGQRIAQQVGLCAVGRATHRRFLCYSHPERIVFDALPATGSA